GDFEQIPPMVSAIKKDGVPLYKLARKGIEVERPARLIHIYYFKVTTYQEPDCHFEIACTKGTYVRSIAHDLGKLIGCGAYLKTLRRRVSGDYDLSKANPLKDLLDMDLPTLSRSLISIERPRPAVPSNT
ncbi:MAG: tRNA pseudouridine(55) synthase, partial [Limisphaerales bacterium]